MKVNTLITYIILMIVGMVGSSLGIWIAESNRPYTKIYYYDETNPATWARLSASYEIQQCPGVNEAVAYKCIIVPEKESNEK